MHSIASKNNAVDAIARLTAFGIAEYFLYPEIHWSAKSSSIAKIREKLNIGIDTIAFVDDQPFEREEVGSVFPEILLFDSTRPDMLRDHPRLMPRFITEDSRKRRRMYIDDMQRVTDEEDYRGPKEEFLSSLNMEFIISEASEDDLMRAEELTIRTNQLNATGRTYDYEELDRFRVSKDHLLLVCELRDKYGSYGKIGLALVEDTGELWHIRLLLMSCRVISRGVGTVLLQFIIRDAKRRNRRLFADFKPTDRNRMMLITFRFAGFQEVDSKGEYVVLSNDLSRVQDFPASIKILFNQTKPENHYGIEC